MSDQLGEGLYIDQNLDFGVGQSGDIQTSSGVDELQKDLAIQMIINLDEYVGSRPADNTKAQISRRAIETALDDSRVQSVRSGSVTVDFSQRNEEISVSMTMITENGEIPLVFEV